ncbi:hypothetical protein HF995_06590 [Sanguibacter hominis ATCC BAA-789]|uniref:Uncharacterized protein n=1 Tax=Sanguibacter hominis ATCC BAA-789 TaxID=1312740 RepID=A0A9X5ISE3_9MICO|nr:hypothetical protein [Sanguibacter hominis]NKX92946.1 hypothetical protein [Sanguibacter hominis ATCC BAA-789]
MSTDQRKLVLKASVGLLAATAVLVPLVLILNRYGPGDMGRGAAVGGSAVLVGFALAAWRAMRRPESTSTLDRVFTRTGDERDDAVATAALAIVGVVSLPASAIATAAVAVGAPALPTLTILLYALLAVAIVAYVVQGRRH